MTVDPLTLGQRITTLLETGRRVSTYKLATLVSLLDHCVEHLPTDPSAPLAVPIEGLAARVIELYWTQVSPYGTDGTRLRQNEQAGQGIPEMVAEVRIAAEARGLRSAAATTERAPDLMRRLVAAVSLVLAQQPLTALQTPGRGAMPDADAFLFDHSWLGKKVRRSELAQRNWEIVLFPGVAAALARLAGLLRPVVQLLWVQDVARLNRLDFARGELSTFLFGADRTSLAPVADGLWTLQDERCFYCDDRIARDDLHVDHVLPFTRTTFDGLANLVAVERRCNLAKSAALPSLGHLRRALRRPVDALESIGSAVRWPVAFPRFRATARGLYLASPHGTPLWRAAGRFEALDGALIDGTFAPDYSDLAADRPVS